LLTPGDVSVEPVIECEPPRVIPPVSLDGRDLNDGCLKGKESGDPTVPAQGIVSGLHEQVAPLSVGPVHCTTGWCQS